MINLISFPDFGCGGLFCTMFNRQAITWSKKFPGAMDNIEHSMLKCGANYMNNWQYSDFEWQQSFAKCQKRFPGKFCGTHIPFDKLNIPDAVNKLVQITTETLSSRCILWIRAHHMIYLPKHSINNMVKQKEFVKDFIAMTFKPYKDAINIELSKYLFDEKYRNSIHTVHDLHFDDQTFKQWIDKNQYIFDLRKSNIPFKVFYDNIKQNLDIPLSL